MSDIEIDFKLDEDPIIIFIDEDEELDNIAQTNSETKTILDYPCTNGKENDVELEEFDWIRSTCFGFK